MRQVPILMYHWFRRADEASQSRSPQLEITPELFRAQMLTLVAAGYRTIGLAEALAAPRVLARRVVLSFDDGTRDFWEHARPILLELDLRATLFIVTDHVGGHSSWDAGLGEPARPLLGWDEIATLADEGFEIGSHSRTHRVFPELRDDEIIDELAGSRTALSERLGRRPELFAYPRGFHEARHRDMVAAAGYTGACAVALELGDLWRGHRFALRRVTIKGDHGAWHFRWRLALARHVRMQDA